MRVFTRDEFEAKRPSTLRELKKSVFIYPTDSIYGIGCDATNESLVQRVRDIKNSTVQPFSVIIPSKEWVFVNCEVSEGAKEWVDLLGEHAEIDGEERPFSLILPLKNKGAVAATLLQGSPNVSVRLPKHWFSTAVAELEVPIVTTSANPTGGDFMKSLEDLHPKVKEKVDLIVYEGEKRGNPSVLVDCTGETISFKRK